MARLGPSGCAAGTRAPWASRAPGRATPESSAPRWGPGLARPRPVPVTSRGVTGGQSPGRECAPRAVPALRPAPGALRAGRLRGGGAQPCRSQARLRPGLTQLGAALGAQERTLRARCPGVEQGGPLGTAPASDLLERTVGLRLRAQLGRGPGAWPGAGAPRGGWGEARGPGLGPGGRCAAWVFTSFKASALLVGEGGWGPGSSRCLGGCCLTSQPGKRKLQQMALHGCAQVQQLGPSCTWLMGKLRPTAQDSHSPQPGWRWPSACCARIRSTVASAAASLPLRPGGPRGEP